MFLSMLIAHGLPNLEPVTVFSIRVRLPLFTASIIASFVSWAVDELLSHETVITNWAGIWRMETVLARCSVLKHTGVSLSFTYAMTSGGSVSNVT